MEYRIGVRCLPVERLHVRDAQARRCPVRRFDHVQSSALCARVIQVHLDAQLPHILLDIEVPLLRIADCVIRIDAVIVRDRAGQHRKPVLETQRQENRIDVRLRQRKRRLIGHLRRDGSISGAVICNAVAGPHDCSIVHSPGEADARRDIVPIRFHQALRESSVEWPSRAGQDVHGCGESGRDIQVDDLVIHFRVWRRVVVPQAEIECEISAEPPIVLNKDIP